ncbi:mechanosensitive ion channel [Croceivirga thetidis]|uniref:Mechanosensitive ion channel n=1 Tax=Croceivirga thetidis TaxID=2721623 RepID=A0ABX1GUA5_9FLAO|nr:mechanosensitive ion channel [Croceivirga thetidis]NKI33533.1 mechanosensitive ion channel [Croceivirga thetidis]
MEYLENIMTSISDSVGDFLPSTIGALLILVIGWFIAGGLKRLTTRLLKRTGIDNRLKSEKITLSKFVGKLIYFLVMIFVFMLALEKLGMQSVLDPVKNLLDGFLAFIPNIIGAGLVGYIGYMLATVVSELVGMSGDTIKKFTPSLGISNGVDIVGILKKVVFIFIFIPLLIAALNILNMDAISGPATSILTQFFNAVPKVLLAAFILILFVIGGKYLTQLVKDLLDNLNLNAVADKMQLKGMVGNVNLAKVISNIVYFFIVIFGLLTAIEKLEFAQLTEVLDTITSISGKILFGLVIILIGNWISVLAKNAFSKNEDNSFVAAIIRCAVLAIFLAMGLKTMGMADDIINLAFGITLGTIAVTIALSFGLGGRPAAGKQMEKILNRFNKN